MDTPVEVERVVKVALEIFRAYDIRGIVGKTLTQETAVALGRAIGSQVLENGERQLVGGRDGRQSGPALLEAFSEGVLLSGCDVVSIGQVATPMLYFATEHLQIPSGVMITGSHNPPDYNGFKIILARRAIHGDEVMALYHRIQQQNFKSGQGRFREENIVEAYLNRIVGDVKLARPFQVVVDCGNGSPGAVAPLLFRKLGCEVEPLFCEVDGNFPNHHPDPGDPANLQDLIAAVKSSGADVGIAFDGDGDRLGVVDSNGKIIWPDRYLMLLIQDVLKRNPGRCVIYDVKSTRHLRKHIERAGGEALMWKTGHSLIKSKMLETNAVLAGEMSGHVFIKDRWYGFDDGLYAGARLLELLSRDARSSAEVFADFPECVSTPELTLDVAEDKKFQIVERLQREGVFTGAERVETLDGLRVEYAKGWGLLRASNTSAKLVARFEADDTDTLKKIQKIFHEQLQVIAPDLKIPF